MLRIYYICALFGFLVANSVQAQVTIGSGNPPAMGALLDLKENDAPDGGATANKGIILPRVSLTALDSLEPVLNAAEANDPTQKNTHKGVIVYNVTINSTTNLQEGFYYWDGSKWVKILGNANDAWLAQGNAGTSAATNFVGTTDNQPLVFKVNKTSAGYIGTDNNTMIGISSGTGLTGGNNNIAIGANTGLPSNTGSNQMNIGNAIFGTGMDGSLTAPAGNIGIKTAAPSSTMTVNGSIAGSYNEITQTSYDVLPTDYVVCYNGTTDATFNLPAITTSIAGRVYYIKNLTTNRTLIISGGSATFRRGGTSPVQATMAVPPGYHAMIVANSDISGSGWDVLSLQNSLVPSTGWLLVATDIVSIINQSQTLTPGTGTTYYDITGSNLTVTVPADLSGNNRIILRWDVWGDVELNESEVPGSGSVRFAVNEQSDEGSKLREHALVTSWASPNFNLIRWSAPIAYALNNVAPGTYTFTLQARRQDEKPTTFRSSPKLWGVQGKAEVYVK